MGTGNGAASSRPVSSAVFLLAVLTLSGVGLIAISGHEVTGAAAYAAHSPILIIGDSNFTTANGVVGGTGSPADPFVIERWQIDASTTNAVEIRDTRASFVIRNLTIGNSNTNPPYYFASYLQNVTDARVESVTVGDRMQGFHVAKSDRVYLSNLNQTSGIGEDVDLSESANATVTQSQFNGTGIRGLVDKNVTISRNHLLNPFTGILCATCSAVVVDSNVLDRGIIRFNFTRDSRIAGNRILGFGWILLGFGGSNNITIEGNEIPLAGAYGIDAFGDDLTIQGNNVSSATEFALAASGKNARVIGNRISDSSTGILVRGDNSSVFHNDFARNVRQAQAEGTRMVWDDGYPSGGNFWSDYMGIDNCSGPNQTVCPNPDGIGDTPYSIDANNSDRYPFMRFLGNDTTPPTVSINSPANGAVFTSSPISVSGTASDAGGSGVRNVQVRTNVGPWLNANGTRSWQVSLGLVPGSNLIEALAIDGAGNPSSLARVTATYNPPPPPGNTPPYANFSFMPASGNTSTMFSFNSTSWDYQDPPSALQVRWDWETDGTWDTPLSTNQTATHMFGSPGNYTVTMEVIDTGGLSANRSALIRVAEVPPPPPPPLNVTITANPTSGTMPLTVSFTSTVSGGVAPYQYEWHFGDGAMSPAANTVHIYVTGGDFPVWLNLYDSARGDAVSDVLFVNVTAAAVNLTVTPPSQFSESSSGITVAFTSSVTGGTPPYTYHWEFGDAGQSFNANPTHTYASPGTYTVTVTVTDAHGNSVTRSFSLVVTGHSTSPTGGSWIYPVALGGASVAAVAFAVLYLLERRRSQRPPR